MTNPAWGADVPVSMPEPLDPNAPGLVSMYGFTMTEWGLRHDLTEADHEEIRRPTYAPQDPTGQRYDDGRT